MHMPPRAATLASFPSKYILIKPLLSGFYRRPQARLLSNVWAGAGAGCVPVAEGVVGRVESWRFRRSWRQ